MSLLRNKIVTTRLTDDEEKELSEYCSKKCLSKSDVIRTLLKTNILKK